VHCKEGGGEGGEGVASAILGNIKL